VGNRGRLKKVRCRSVTNCERERAPNVAELQKQFTEALQQQTATADILRAIASSPTDLQSVLDTLVESAARLCDASDAVLLLREDDFLRIAARSRSKWWWLANTSANEGKPDDERRWIGPPL
jgi:hypothetical protein